MTETVLVTGSAGFIGYHTCKRLLADGFKVVGLDALSDYYDVSLKEARHAQLTHERFIPVIGRVETGGLKVELFESYNSYYVAYLAARVHPPNHMLLASTSSAFGANTEMPYAETQRAEHQMSFYVATKKSTENMGHSYAHLFDAPVTIFRFLTVYGAVTTWRCSNLTRRS